jgi:general stress protein YciG
MSNPEVMAKYRKEFARQGGLRGGKARAAVLTEERRKEIGRQGGLARWGKHV